MSIDEGTFAACTKASRRNDDRADRPASARRRVAVVGAAVLGLLSVVGIRLLLEIRDCRRALIALVAVAGCYATAVVTQLQWIMEQTGSTGVMLEEGYEMVGDLFLLLSMGLYARYVKLDAEGLLPAESRLDKKAEAKKRQKAILDATPTSSVATKQNDLDPVAKTAQSAASEARAAKRHAEPG